jgi:hypothetical protein
VALSLTALFWWIVQQNMQASTLPFRRHRDRPRDVLQVFRSFLTSIFWAAFVGCAIHAYKEAAIRRFGAFLSECGRQAHQRVSLAHPLLRRAQS